MQTHLNKALLGQKTCWTTLERAYIWVWRAAQLLNDREAAPREVQRRYATLLERLRAAKPELGELEGAMDHFLKVTASYQPYLFHTYAVPGLPATNNSLEQLFGSFRHHERRILGRKVTSSSTVLRGPVRLIACLATRAGQGTPEQLAPRCLSTWKRVRSQLETRHEGRREQRRFRRDPLVYLAQLEHDLLSPSLLL